MPCGYQAVGDAVYERPEFPRRKHDGLQTILHVVRAGLDAVAVQNRDRHNVYGAFHREVYRLVHEYLERSVGYAERESLHGQDPVAELVVLVHRRTEAHAHEAVPESPRRVEVEDVPPPEERLAEPVPQQVYHDVDNRLGRDRLLAQGVLVRSPGVEGYAHPDLGGGPAACHPAVDVEDRKEDIAEARGQEGGVEELRGEGPAVGVPPEEDPDEGGVVLRVDVGAVDCGYRITDEGERLPGGVRLDDPALVVRDRHGGESGAMRAREFAAGRKTSRSVDFRVFTRRCSRRTRRRRWVSPVRHIRRDDREGIGRRLGPFRRLDCDG